jgi:GNAT superfamily N-acetyltransferase
VSPLSHESFSRSQQPAYLTLLEKAFPGIKNNILRCAALGFSWEAGGQLFIQEEKGVVHSHVALLDCPLLIEGHWYKMGALHGICTQADYRGQGLASRLILEALEWAKNRYEWVILFTEIPTFYEKFSFRYLQEYRFHLPCAQPQGKQSLRSVVAPKDDALFLRCFHNREPLSNEFWVQDKGAIASFNTLFATYPTYWSLYYSPAIDGFISWFLEGTTLHLLDVIASKMPSLDCILDHLPASIHEIYFYFPPDRFTAAATPEPYLYDHGYLMIHGTLPYTQPLMISPLSRC